MNEGCDVPTSSKNSKASGIPGKELTGMDRIDRINKEKEQR
jgi:hypothetical protein